MFHLVLPWKAYAFVGFFEWRATTGLLNRCFGVTEMNSQDAVGYLEVLSRVDYWIRWVYHQSKD